MLDTRGGEICVGRGGMIWPRMASPAYISPPTRGHFLPLRSPADICVSIVPYLDPPIAPSCRQTYITIDIVITYPPR